jgi:hypothetical protein
MLIEISYEIDISEEDLALLRRYWEASIGENFIQSLMETAGHNWLIEHIKECKRNLHAALES